MEEPMNSLNVSLFLAVTLLSCGSAKDSAPQNANVNPEPLKDSATPQAEEEDSKVLNLESDLPPCESKREGALVYIKQSKAFKFCSEGKWRDIEIKGAKGEPGTKGDTGEAGSPATATKITQNVFCSGNLTQQLASSNNLSIPSGGLDFTFDTNILTSGDVFVAAKISSSAMQTSTSNFFSASQNGATNPGVTITDDWDGTSSYGWWNIQLNRSTKVVTLTYNDNSLPNSSSRVFSFPPERCMVQSF